jgi:hypothetical protein
VIVSVINLSNGRCSDAEVQRAIRAINRQIAQDFAPYWGFGGTLRLEGRTSRGRGISDQADMRGDAVLYIWDGVDPDGADGFHYTHYRGIPFGVVYLGLSELLDEKWTVTFSHEALELIADPEVNLLVQGPHPEHPRRLVYYWFEMCDAVQEEQYAIDGILLSNFVLPLYFTSSAEYGGRNDFLGTRVKARSLRSFGVNEGGYAGYFDPKTGKDREYQRKDDAVAQRRLRLKKRLRTGRGTLRRRRTLGR